MVRIIWYLIGFLLLLTALCYFNQRQLIYFPSTDVPQAQGMQPIHLVTSDGLAITGWYVPAKKQKPTIFILHGNARDVDARMPLARYFMKQDYGVFLVEYRGYGGNPGRPSEQGLYRDAEAAFHYLSTQAVPAKNIVIYGESLGTGVATQLAMHHPICALILQSPFASLPAVAAVHYPWILIEPWDKYDSMARIKQIHAPVLIIHGTVDKIVPYAQGKALYEQANEPKQFISLENKGHGQLWDASFFMAVNTFIKKYDCRTQK